MATARELTVRPVRPADRARVLEITRDVWEGRDYIPRVFDEWVGDASAAFQALEVEGQVVGLHRVRPYAPGLVWYEGLRVASDQRRRGLARTLVQSAIAEAREQGFKEMRLATQNEPAAALFESAGFKRLVDIRWWRALRLEGGEPARMPDADGLTLASLIRERAEKKGTGIGVVVNEWLRRDIRASAKRAS